MVYGTRKNNAMQLSFNDIPLSQVLPVLEFTHHFYFNIVILIAKFWNGVHLEDEEREDLETRGCR